MSRPITDADIEAALIDLREGAGPRWDPPLVEVFAEVVSRMRRAEAVLDRQEREMRDRLDRLRPHNVPLHEEADRA